MNVVFTLITIVLVGMASYFVGRASKTPVTPVTPTAPEPRKFGLEEAEAVRERLNGKLDEKDADTVKVVVSGILGLPFVVNEEAAQFRATLTGNTAMRLEAIGSLRLQIAEHESAINYNDQRNASMAELVSAFGG